MLEKCDDFRVVTIYTANGCGKSTLANAIAAQLGLRVVSLDDYLEKQQGGSLNFLTMNDYGVTSSPPIDLWSRAFAFWTS